MAAAVVDVESSMIAVAESRMFVVAKKRRHVCETLPPFREKGILTVYEHGPS